MADIVSEKKRSAMMAGVRQKNTKPELLIRKQLHRLGLRYRLHVKKLPGSPDLVFPKYKAVVFVHGCFWHQHPGCRKSRRPESRGEWWNEKLQKNVERDRRKKLALKRQGWRVLTIWECDILHHPEEAAGDLCRKIRSSYQTGAASS